MFLKLPFEARHGLPVAFVGICQSVGEPRSLGFACRRHAFNIHARSALGIDRGGEGRNVLLSFPTLGRQEIGTCSNDEFPVDGIGVDVGEFRLFGARGTEESQRIALALGECVGLPHRCSASGDIEEGRIECRCGVAPMRTAESYLFVKIRKRTLLSATCPPASLGTPSDAKCFGGLCLVGQSLLSPLAAVRFCATANVMAVSNGRQAIAG